MDIAVLLVCVHPCLVLPRLGLVDRLPVDAKPRSQLLQSLLEDWDDGALPRGTHVDQDVSAAAHSRGHLKKGMLLLTY